MTTKQNFDPDERNERKPLKYSQFAVPFFLLLFLGCAVWFVANRNPKGLFSRSQPAQVSSLKNFEDNFQRSEIIEETNKMSTSSSNTWWVNSGGLMEVSGGTAKTIQGDFPKDEKWAKKYASNNPDDTDGGSHPQNIFRLVTKGKWQDFIQQAYFRINKMNLGVSENRNESNGILLFNRYEDGDNLYYTGLRVDGSAVIKKKYGGKYYTLAEKKFFPGEEYDKDKNPNMLPLNEWMGLRSEFRNTEDGNVEIRLFADEGRTGEWKLAVQVVDDGKKSFGTHILSDEGYAGIRTDFMDVEFSDYKIDEI